MDSLRVLITNTRLESPTGTELYVRDLALKLLERGHLPIVYSPHLGYIAKELRRMAIPVIDDLNMMASPPDVIHGHHNDETVNALLRFPNIPAIYVCHDWFSKRDEPPQFPRILRYIAVDQTCHDKLVFEYGISEDRVRMLYSFVDLKRFKPRPPLPRRPRRALVLCHHTTENAHLEAVRRACARTGLTLDVFGLGVKKPCLQTETLLCEYDIVFARGRTALEALAVGTAVVIYWWRQIGPMVTTRELERLRPLNFGIRAMGPRLSPEEFGREIECIIERYDAEDAAEVSARVRATAGSDDAADEIISTYREVIAEHKSGTRPDLETEARAASAYFRQLSLSVQLEREALYNSTFYRVKERLRRIPLAGKASHWLARTFIGRPTP